MDNQTQPAEQNEPSSLKYDGPKHTPGPWSLPHFAQPDVNCECKYVLCDHMMGAVASVYCSGEGDDWQTHGDNPKFSEAVANAKLIAAAPDMFNALDKALDALDAYHINYEPDGSNGVAVRDIVRAAMRKALHGDAT